MATAGTAAGIDHRGATVWVGDDQQGIVIQQCLEFVASEIESIISTAEALVIDNNLDQTTRWIDQVRVIGDGADLELAIVIAGGWVEGETVLD